MNETGQPRKKKLLFSPPPPFIFWTGNILSIGGSVNQRDKCSTSVFVSMIFTPSFCASKGIECELNVNH